MFMSYLLFVINVITNQTDIGRLGCLCTSDLGYLGGAQWSSGQCTRRAIAEAKHRSQWPVLG
jgi:hypothetical protein